MTDGDRLNANYSIEANKPNFQKSSDDKMLDCCCILKHKSVSNWNCTVDLVAQLRVSQINPLVIGTSDAIYVCPFMFWLRAELVQNKYRLNEKWFKIILSCRNANAGFDGLPVSTFRFAFHLINHNKNGVNKTYEGTWYYPKHKELYWHSITYPQLIHPGSGWINYYNHRVEVQTQLMKIE